MSINLTNTVGHIFGEPRTDPESTVDAFHLLRDGDTISFLGQFQIRVRPPYSMSLLYAIPSHGTFDTKHSALETVASTESSPRPSTQPISAQHKEKPSQSAARRPSLHAHAHPAEGADEPRGCGWWRGGRGCEVAGGAWWEG